MHKIILENEDLCPILSLHWKLRQKYEASHQRPRFSLGKDSRKNVDDIGLPNSENSCAANPDTDFDRTTAAFPCG